MKKIEYAKKVAEIAGGEYKLEAGDGICHAIITLGGYAEYLADALQDRGYSPQEAAEVILEDFKEKEEEYERRKALVTKMMREDLMPASWKQAKPIVNGFLMNKSEAEKMEVWFSAEKYGFDDLVIVPTLKGPKGMRNVVKRDLSQWDISSVELLEAILENIEDPEFIPISDPSEVLIVAVTNSPFPFDSFGAIGILKAREALSCMFPDGYTVIPSSKTEMIVFPGHSDEDWARGIIQDMNESVYVRSADTLGTKPYYFEGRNA